jgi:hypothetical protein
MQTTLPPRPDEIPIITEEPPKKRRGWTIAGSILGGLLVLGGLGSLVDQNAAEGTATAIEPDWEQATALVKQVNTELGFITPNSTVESDLIHLDRIIDLQEQEAALFDGTNRPEIATFLRSSADHVQAARDAEAAGDFDTFSQEMSLAGDDLARMLDEVPGA